MMMKFDCSRLLLLTVILLFVTGLDRVKAQWVQTNGLYTGTIYCIAANGIDLYAGGNGLFHSTDNGTTWTRVGFTDTLVQALLATGTELFASTSSYGLFRSTDGGASWGFSGAFVPTTFAVIGSYIFAGTNSTVYRSTNAGISWDEVNSGLPGGAGQCFAVKGTNLYTGTSGSGVYMTADSGGSWNSINNGLPVSGSVASLASSDTNLIAGIYDCSPSNGIYISSDSGLNWSQVPFGLYVTTLVVKGPDVFALAPSGGGSCGQSGGLFRSTDNGMSWDPIVVPNGSYTSCMVTNNTNLFVGSYHGIFSSYGGIFRSADNGAHWQSTGLGLSYLSMSCLVRVGTKLFAGTNGGGVFVSNDDGDNWIGAGSELTNSYILCLAESVGNLFAGTGDGIFLSTNNGASWNVSNNGIPSSHSVNSIAVSDNHVLAALGGGEEGSAGVYVSSDGGGSWNVTSLTGYNYSSVVIHAGIFFVGHYTGGVFRSSDNGVNWEPAISGLTNLNVSLLASNDTILIVSTGSGIFRSADDGSNWYPVETTFGTANNLYFSGSNLFASTSNGVFQSPNGGTYWVAITNDLPVNSAASMNGLVVKDTVLFAANYDNGGIWRRTMLEIAVFGQSVDHNADWNLLSLPLTVTNNTVSSLFPNVISNAFAYQGSYVTSTTLDNGKGYWLKFSSSGSDSILGETITIDTIGINQNWNIIGSISSPVSVSSITSIPPGIVTSNFFGYSNGYFTADTLYPGKGYWVKANQSGSIILDANTLAGLANRIHIVPTSETPPLPPTSDEKKLETVPLAYALIQNYPNPFNPSTIIRYELPEPSHVSLAVFDMLGREIQSLVNEKQVAGRYKVEFASTNLPSGVYICQIKAGAYVSSRKILLLR